MSDFFYKLIYDETSPLPKLFREITIHCINSPRPAITVKFLIKFLFSIRIKLSFKQRVILLQRFVDIDNNIDCAHSFDELLIPACKILELSPSQKGCIVEAGSFKGGGTAKLSIVAQLCNRKLYVFDSFKGLPDNNEPPANTTMNYTCLFNKGDWVGSLEEVKDNVKKFGEIKVCHFIKGYFNKTMPHFKKKVAAVYSDVDLVTSNKTCLKYLWPNLVNKGFYFSQDAHIPAVNNLFLNQDFWENEMEQIPSPFMYITKRFGIFQKVE